MHTSLNTGILDSFNRLGLACFNRTKYAKYFSCIIGSSPSVAKLPHYAVLGSRGVVGLALVRELKSRNLRFVEVKSKYHVDLLQDTFEQLAKEVNIKFAFLLIGDGLTGLEPNFWDLLSHSTNSQYGKAVAALERSRIPFICLIPWSLPTDIKSLFDSRLENLIERSTHGHLIRIPHVYGQSFRGPRSNMPLQWVDRAIEDSNVVIEPQISSEHPFIHAHDLAKILVDLALNRTFPKHTIIDTPVTTAGEIGAAIMAQFPGTRVEFEGMSRHLPPIGFYRIKANFEHYDAKKAVTEMEICINQQKTKQKSFYLSIVIPTDSSQKRISLLNNSIQFMAKALTQLPDSPIEIVIVNFGVKPTEPKAYQMINIPKIMRGRMRFIQVSSEFESNLKKSLNCTHFLEFHAKNIGIRRARGEYIAASTGDVVFPRDMYEAARRRVFGVLTVLRSEQIKLAEGEDRDLFHLKWLPSVPPSIPQGVSVPGAIDQYYLLNRDASGTFITMHRRMWYELQGHCENHMRYHVDSLMLQKTAAFLGGVYSVHLPKAYHLYHTGGAKSSPKFDKFWVHHPRFACNGDYRRMIICGDNPNWGFGNVEFPAVNV